MDGIVNSIILVACIYIAAWGFGTLAQEYARAKFKRDDA